VKLWRRSDEQKKYPDVEISRRERIGRLKKSAASPGLRPRYGGGKPHVLFLVRRAYSVRALGALVEDAGLCVVPRSLTPAWRYDAAYLPADLAALAAALPPLETLSLADEFWAEAVNHRFLAVKGAGPVCATSAPRDPADAALAPAFAWPPMRWHLADALRNGSAAALLGLASPGTFGHLTPDGDDAAVRRTPPKIRAALADAVADFPPDTADVVERIDGCAGLADLLGRAVDARAAAAFDAMAAFFGLRLLPRADLADECAPPPPARDA
jgi:hypothetical protein